MTTRKAEVLLKWLAKAPPGPVVELGCTRYDHESESEGFSTFYLAKQCASEGREFRSFDINPNHVLNARRILSDHGLVGTVQALPGDHAVKLVPAIAFLYLDTSDNAGDTMHQYLNADMAPGGIIVIDDCHSYGAGQFGKGTKVIEFLGLDKIRFEKTGDFIMAVIQA